MLMLMVLVMLNYVVTCIGVVPVLGTIVWAVT